MSNAQLGRDVVAILREVSGTHCYAHYVNKTQKYISVKVDTEHLTDEQIQQASEKLAFMHPNRFLKCYKGTATGSRIMSYDPLQYTTWKYPKMLVRFTQK